MTVNGKRNYAPGIFDITELHANVKFAGFRVFDGEDNDGTDYLTASTPGFCFTSKGNADGIFFTWRMDVINPDNTNLEEKHYVVVSDTLAEHRSVEAAKKAADNEAIKFFLS